MLIQHLYLYLKSLLSVILCKYKEKEENCVESFLWYYSHGTQPKLLIIYFHFGELPFLISMDNPHDHITADVVTNLSEADCYMLIATEAFTSGSN